MSDLKVIIVDEISMVSNNLFYVHIRLNEIFGSVTQEPFAGLTVIAVGCFFQLPLVGGRHVYSPDRYTLRNFDSLWKRLRLFEFNEVMRQRGESQLIDLLDSVCTTYVKPSDVELFASRVINSDHKDSFFFFLTVPNLKN